MTKKDFFMLLIKVFGLFSVVTSLFSILPGNIAFAITITDIGVFSIIWVAAAVIVVIGLFILLIFKSGKVVTLLKLDKGFDDERIELGNLKAADMIKIGTLIIGGLLILDNIPIFLSHTLFAFMEDIAGLMYQQNDKIMWAVSGLNLVIGYLLLTNYDFVANRLSTEKKEKV